MNGYICMWKGKRCEVHACTTYAAQQQAISEFKKVAGRRKVKGSDITVVLCEKDRKQVTHAPLF